MCACLSIVSTQCEGEDDGLKGNSYGDLRGQTNHEKDLDTLLRVSCVKLHPTMPSSIPYRNKSGHIFLSNHAVMLTVSKRTLGEMAMLTNAIKINLTNVFFKVNQVNIHFHLGF